MKSLVILENNEKNGDKSVVISDGVTAPLLLLIGEVILKFNVTFSENRRLKMSSHILDGFNVGSHVLHGAPAEQDRLCSE